MEEESLILVVDDTRPSLDYLTDILTDQGYRVRQSDNGPDALQAVVDRPPSLILLDISMPGMGGFEVCRRLKARPESKGIPILFISGVAALRERVEGFALGAVDFISKPFQQGELLARVRTHLELNRLRTDLEVQVAARTAELLFSEAKLRSLFSAMSDVIFVLDQQGRCVEIAPTRADGLYRPSVEWLGKDLAEIMTAEEAAPVKDAVRRAIASTETLAVDYSQTVGNRTYWFSAMISPLSDDAAIVVSRDITDRKHMEENLWEMSFRDQLTGLYNRRGFLSLAEQQMKAAARSKSRIPLIFVDVDNMKWVNDSLGHEEGDRMLRDTADVFRQTFRDADILARIGGDEFVIFVKDCMPESIEAISGRLENNLIKSNALYNRDPENPSLSFSFGVAIHTEGDFDITEIFKTADERMYRKKRERKMTV